MLDEMFQRNPSKAATIFFEYGNPEIGAYGKKLKLH